VHPWDRRTLGRGRVVPAGSSLATAVALEEVHVLVIPADRLEHVVRTNPQLAIAIIRQLARMAAGDSGSD